MGVLLMYEQCLRLFEIQKIDVKLEELFLKKEKLKTSNELIQIQAHKSNLQSQWDLIHQQLTEDRRELRQSEYDLSEIGMHVEELNGKIFDSATKSKELQFLLQEKDVFQEKTNKIETDIINLLITIEKNEHLQNAQKELLIDINDRIDKLSAELKVAIINAEEDISALKNDRQRWALGIDEKLFKEYESKRKRLKNEMVSLVDNSQVCQGCHVKISNRAFKKLLEKEVARCEECGRYLLVIM